MLGFVYPLRYQGMKNNIEKTEYSTALEILSQNPNERCRVLKCKIILFHNCPFCIIHNEYLNNDQWREMEV